MACDALAGALSLLHGEGEPFPSPTSMLAFTPSEHSFISLIRPFWLPMDEDAWDRDFEIPEQTARAILEFCGMQWPGDEDPS